MLRCVTPLLIIAAPVSFPLRGGGVRDIFLSLRSAMGPIGKDNGEGCSNLIRVRPNAPLVSAQNEPADSQAEATTRPILRARIGRVLLENAAQAISVNTRAVVF